MGRVDFHINAILEMARNGKKANVEKIDFSKIINFDHLIERIHTNMCIDIFPLKAVSINFYESFRFNTDLLTVMRKMFRIFCHSLRITDRKNQKNIFESPKSATMEVK